MQHRTRLFADFVVYEILGVGILLYVKALFVSFAFPYPFAVCAAYASGACAGMLYARAWRRGFCTHTPAATMFVCVPWSDAWIKVLGFSGLLLTAKLFEYYALIGLELAEFQTFWALLPLFYLSIQVFSKHFIYVSDRWTNLFLLCICISGAWVFVENPHAAEISTFYFISALLWLSVRALSLAVQLSLQVQFRTNIFTILCLGNGIMSVLAAAGAFMIEFNTLAEDNELGKKWPLLFFVGCIAFFRYAHFTTSDFFLDEEKRPRVLRAQIRMLLTVVIGAIVFQDSNLNLSTYVALTAVIIFSFLYALAHLRAIERQRYLCAHERLQQHEEEDEDERGAHAKEMHDMNHHEERFVVNENKNDEISDDLHSGITASPDRGKEEGKPSDM